MHQETTVTHRRPQLTRVCGGHHDHSRGRIRAATSINGLPQASRVTQAATGPKAIEASSCLARWSGTLDSAPTGSVSYRRRTSFTAQAPSEPGRSRTRTP